MAPTARQLTITGRQLSSCDRDVRRAILPLRWSGELRDASDRGRCVHDAPPSRGFLLRDAWLLRDDGAPRRRDVRPPYDDALPLVWTYVAPLGFGIQLGGLKLLGVC